MIKVLNVFNTLICFFFKGRYKITELLSKLVICCKVGKGTSLSALISEKGGEHTHKSSVVSITNVVPFCSALFVAEEVFDQNYAKDLRLDLSLSAILYLIFCIVGISFILIKAFPFIQFSIFIVWPRYFAFQDFFNLLSITLFLYIGLYYFGFTVFIPIKFV